MTGTQKFLAIAAAGGALLIAIALFTHKAEDPKTPPSVLEPTSSGVVTAPPTVAPAPPPTPGTNPAPTVVLTAPLTSGAPVDMATLAQEAKIVAEARAALNAGEPRKALAAIERYEKIPDRGSLTPEATLVKIEALAKVSGRRTDALALGMSTRDDPKMASYQPRVEALLQDAGLIGEVQQPTVP